MEKLTPENLREHVGKLVTCKEEGVTGRIIGRFRHESFYGANAAPAILVGHNDPKMEGWTLPSGGSDMELFDEKYNHEFKFGWFVGMDETELVPEIQFSPWKPRPMHTVVVDMVCFRENDRNETEVLLIRRGKPPFEGKWALPGGFVEHGEQTLKAAVRELEEETGLVAPEVRVSLVGVYDAPGRDPRGPNVGVAYWTWMRGLPTEVQGADDAAEAKWFYVDELPELAFDHYQIVLDALEQYEGA